MWASCCNWLCLDSATVEESSSSHRSSSRHQAYTNSGYNSYPSPTAPEPSCKACGGRFDALERKVIYISCFFFFFSFFIIGPDYDVSLIYLKRLARSIICSVVLTFVLAVILQNVVFPTMYPKKVSEKDSAEKKKQTMCTELKKKMIEKHDQGVRVVDLMEQYERSTSVLCTLLK